MLNFDMTFSKNFPLKSEKRVLMFRAEMYNIFNHPQFTGANIGPSYDWNNWKNGVLVQTSQHPGPVHRHAEPAADVHVAAVPVLVTRFLREGRARPALVREPESYGFFEPLAVCRKRLVYFGKPPQVLLIGLIDDVGEPPHPDVAEADPLTVVLESERLFGVMGRVLGHGAIYRGPQASQVIVRQ